MTPERARDHAECARGPECHERSRNYAAAALPYDRVERARNYAVGVAAVTRTLT